jgi:hypothetical protein
MVSSLVWYSGTHKFFDTHYYEIMEIVEDLADSGFKIEITGEDLKNKLAWLAFEEEAYQMAYNGLGVRFLTLFLFLVWKFKKEVIFVLGLFVFLVLPFLLSEQEKYELLPANQLLLVTLDFLLIQ